MKENLRKSCRAECRKSIFAGILVLVCLGIFALMNACEIICVERECTRAKHEIFFLRDSISNFATSAANKDLCKMQNSPHCNAIVHMQGRSDEWISTKATWLSNVFATAAKVIASRGDWIGFGKNCAGCMDLINLASLAHNACVRKCSSKANDMLEQRVVNDGKVPTNDGTSAVRFSLRGKRESNSRMMRAVR